MKKALVIVAHPDDETIWMGGTILKYNKWEWTIVSLCRKCDENRFPKFIRACKFYGAKGYISDLDDENLKPLNEKEIINKILKIVPNDKYDYIFTHGENGEYGHIRHKEIHSAVKKMFDNCELKGKKLYFFSYIPGKEIAIHDSDLKIPVANKKSDYLVQIKDKIYKEKIHVIRSVYGFGKGIFETLSCKREEAFLLYIK